MAETNLTIIYIAAFGTSAFVILCLIGLLLDTGKNALSQNAKVVRLLILGLIIWPLMALIVGLNVELEFPVLGVMIALPIIISCIVLLNSSVSKVLIELPLHWLVALSFYRVVGVLFLYLYFSGSEILSRGFALNAGWGDLMTGLLALPVAWFVYKRKPYAYGTLIAWTIFGILDLFVAPGSAFYYGVEQLAEFPISFIPIFLGPPFGIVLHLITWRVAWLQKQAKGNASSNANTN